MKYQAGAEQTSAHPSLRELIVRSLEPEIHEAAAPSIYQELESRRSLRSLRLIGERTHRSTSGHDVHRRRRGSIPDTRHVGENYTLGVVFEPSPNYSFGFDGFYVKLKETIIFGVSPTAILADIDRFGNLVTRGAPEAATPGLPGRIVNIDQVNLNFGETKVAGVDADFRTRFDVGRAGAITASIVGTYFTKYDIQNPDGSFDSILAEVTPIVNGAGGLPSGELALRARRSQLHG